MRLNTALAHYACHVSHFAPWPSLRLAVEVDAHARLAQNSLEVENLLADQDFHFDFSPMTPSRAERPADDGSDVLFELGRHRSIQSPMPGIMDPRRDFIDAKLLRPVARRLNHENFDGDDADIVQRLGDGAGQLHRLRRCFRRNPRRRAAEFQNVIFMTVFANVIGGEGAVMAPRGDDGDFFEKGTTARESLVHRRASGS